MSKPTLSDFNKIIIKSLDTNKINRPDSMPAKFLQISANVTDCHLSNIIACDISKNIVNFVNTFLSNSFLLTANVIKTIMF